MSSECAAIGLGSNHIAAFFLFSVQLVSDCVMID